MFKICIVIIFLTSLAFAQESRPQEMQVLLRKISNSKCSSSAVNFRACMAALDAMSFRSNGIRIVPKDFAWAALKKAYDVEVVNIKTVDELDYVRLRVITNSSEITEKIKNLLNEEMTEINNAWEEDFLNRSTPLDIERLIHDLLSVYSPSDVKTLSLAGLAAYSVHELKDGHASFTSASIEHRTSGPTDKEVVGIGIQYAVEQSGIRVKEILEGSAAQENDLRQNDLIVKVDGKDNFDARGAFRLSELLIGEVGGLVEIEFFRGKNLIKRKFQRSKYIIKLTDFKTLTHLDQKIGHIKLRTFDHRNACQEVKEYILKAKLEGVSAFILDLRGNGGGMEEQARCLAGLFLKEHQTLYKYYNYKENTLSDVTPLNPDPVFNLADDREEDSHGLPQGLNIYPRSQTLYVAPPKSRFPVEDKLVVLINSGSASASEMIAGGLRDQLRAIIVGETSFGKGCGQRGDQIPGTGVFMMSTKYYFLRPSGVSAQQVGIVPDILVSGEASLREAQIIPYSLPAVLNGTIPAYPELQMVDLCRKKMTEKVHNDRELDTSMKVISCLK